MIFIKNQKSYRSLRPFTSFIENAIYSIICAKFQFCFNSNTLLDAFAGTGRLGLLLFNKCRIKKAFFVEKNTHTCKALLNKINFRQDLKVVCANFFKFIYEDKFDIIILDPPYKYNLSNKLINFISVQNYVNKDTLIIMRKHVTDKILYEEYTKLDLLYDYIHKYNQCLFFKIK